MYFPYWSYLQFHPRAFHIYSSLFSWESYCKIYSLNICMVLFKYTMWYVYFFKEVLHFLCEWVCEGPCITALVQRPEEDGRSSSFFASCGAQRIKPSSSVLATSTLSHWATSLVYAMRFESPFIKKNTKEINETSRSYRIGLFMYYIYLYKNPKVFYSPRCI